MKKTSFLALLCATVAFGCTPASHVQPDTQGVFDKGLKGRAIVSLTHYSPGLGIIGAKLRVVREGTQRPNHGIAYHTSQVRGNPDSNKIAVEDGALLGEVVLLELEPGRYVVDQWIVGLSQYVDFFGNVELISDKYHPIQFKFDVLPGKTTYVGNIQVNVKGRHLADSSLRNASSRDIALLIKKYPTIDAKQIDINLMHQ